MKKMILSLVAMLTIAVSARAMSYEQARNEALFLTDKMAYELNLTDAQYEAAYEINLDYLMGVASYDDVFGTYWERRNLDLSYILLSWQWDAFRAAAYFYRPLYWRGGYWHFGIYARYPRRDYFYFGRPHFYASYRGGHSWHMNGNRSYYHHHRDHFRPVGNPHRDHHIGMRSAWDRGDFRTGRNSSSTRTTVNNSGRTSFGASNPNNVERNRGTIGNSNVERNRGTIGNNRPISRPSTTEIPTGRVVDRSSFGASRSASSATQVIPRSSMPSRSSSAPSSSAPSRSFGSSSSSSRSSGSFGASNSGSSRGNSGGGFGRHR